MARLQKLRTRLSSPTGLTISLVVSFVVIVLGLALAIKYRLGTTLPSKHNPPSIAAHPSTPASGVPSSLASQNSVATPTMAGSPSHPLTLGDQTTVPATATSTTQSVCPTVMQTADQTYLSGLKNAENDFENKKSLLSPLTDTLNLTALIKTYNSTVDNLYKNYLSDLSAAQCGFDQPPPAHK